LRLTQINEEDIPKCLLNQVITIHILDGRAIKIAIDEKTKAGEVVQ
jgi:hypothetical protein